MTTRPELLEIIKELDITDETEGLPYEEKIEIVKKTIDKRFDRRYNVSADKISTTLRKYMVLEYDYKIEDKEGNELDYNLKEK